MRQDEKEVLSSLMSKLPEFKSHWFRYSEEEKSLFDDEFEPSLYEVATEFSVCVIEQFKRDNRGFLRDAFVFIEELSRHPSEDISECAMVGFVEGVLMHRSHEGIALDAFDDYLGDESREFWYAMHDFFTNGA